MYLTRTIRSIFHFLVISLGMIAQVQGAASVGSDQGNIEVTRDGQAVWTLPISVPPGVRGLVPNLSLSVSAQGQLNLNGLSSISRCAGLAVDHGTLRPVRYVASDHYCLDGQPLVLISGVQGEDGSVYRTQLDSFERIEAVGTGVNSPVSFKLTTRSGGTLTFGGTPLSKTIRASDGTITSWAVSSLEDVSGNGLWYTYADISDNAIAEIALTRISYGSQTQSQAPVTVDFIYELRPDSTSGYQLGVLVQSTKRLAQFATTADNKIARRFKISYEQSDFGGYSRVTQVHECAVDDNDNGRETCYRPSVFEYAPVQTGWQNLVISQPSPLQDSQGRSRGAVVDINNDGFNDWIIAVQPHTGAAHIETWLGSESDWSGSAAFTLPGPLFDYSLHDEGIPVGNLLDINGDGLIDYVQAYHQTHADGSTTLKQVTWLNSGNGFVQGGVFQPPDYTVIIQADGGIEAAGQYRDINGDGLPDMIKAVRRADGTSSHLTQLNTGSGWSVSSAYTLPVDALFSDHSIGPEGVYQGELIDINADGLVDFVQSARLSATTIRANTYLNTGNGWIASAAYQIPIPLVDYSEYPKGIPNAELVDINGDGLIDIWQALRYPGKVNQYSAWLNTGDGFVLSSGYTPVDRSTFIRSTGAAMKWGELMDLNGDGQPEHVIHAIREDDISITTDIYEHSGSQWVRNDDLAVLLPGITFYLQPSDENQSSRRVLQLADLNGDGLAEAFVSMDTANGWQVKSSVDTLDNGVQPGYLIAHTNGLGIETRVEYGLSTLDSTLYTPADVGQNTRASAAVNTPMVLVKAIEKMDGLVHPQAANINDGSSGWYRARHHYGGLKTNLEGRGSLGFATRTITDDRSGLTVMSEFYQDYPFTGQSKAIRKYQNTTLLSETATTVEQRDLNNGKTLFAYSPGIVAKQYDPDSGALLSTTTTTSVYDDYGNVSSKTQVVNGTVDGSTQTLETITSTTYENKTGGDDWMLGLPTDTTVTMKASNQPDQRNTTTAQYNNLGFPISEVLQPGHPQSVSTHYSYDSYGNVISTIVTSGSESRTSTVDYGPDGRFPITSTNPLGHTRAVSIDSRWGKPVSQINPNQLEQKTIYDAFGTVLREDALWDGKTQAKEVALAYWCETDSGCPANAVYFVAALDDQGESPQTVYFDAYGRELLKKTSGADLNNNDIADGPTLYIATGYDALGRKINASRPGTDQTTLDYEHVSYDALDRVRSKTAADGTVTTIDYDGLTVITTNAKGQISQVTNDLRGKPVLSVDADNNPTRYEYDARGNLIVTTDSQGNQIKLVYDQFGRKTSMDDPDMGFWTYAYDGFGNLIQQTDAKGQNVTMVYDKLNRLISRTEPEGTTTWTYDTAALGTGGRHGIGLLASVSAGHEGYSRQHEYDSSGRSVKETIHIKGQDYVSERGYYRATDQVAWERYPSGLVVTREYDPSGFPLRLSSVNLSEYQSYLTEYYTYEDKVQAARMAEAEHQQQLDGYRELLLGEKTGVDVDGNPTYAGGGLEDQVKEKTDLINSARSSAQSWQCYASDAAAVLNDHAQWSQDYYAEYQRYRGPYEYEIGRANHYGHLSDQEQAKAQPYINRANDFIRRGDAHIHTGRLALRNGCLMMGPHGLKKRYNGSGHHVGWDYQSEFRVCKTDANLSEHQMLGSNQVNPSAAPYWFGEWGREWDKARADYNEAQRQQNLAQPYINRANSYANTANSHASKANRHVRGMTVYGAMANNHGLVALLFNDDKGDNNPGNDTGRYAYYKGKVEDYAGVWQCKAIGQVPLLSGTYINGSNPNAIEQQWLEDYADPAKGPFKPVPAGFGAASLISWDSDADGQLETWYLNHATQKMVQAEKRPIYKREHCKSNELWVQTSTGLIGTYLNALYTDSPFYLRNYLYYQIKVLTEPINELIESANTQYELVQTKETEYKASSTVYWEALAYSADGQIKQARYGNGVESVWGYDARGRTISIVAEQNSAELQKQFFAYDPLGNLAHRDDITNDVFETFQYDSLNRLTHSALTGTGANLYQLTGNETQSYQYDAIGNLTYKSDVGQYTYGSGMGSGNAGIHAMVSTSGAINASFSYDSNGNQTSGAGRTTTWASYNKPVQITKNGAINEFTYGPERQLIYQKQTISTETRETRYIGGIYEETITTDGNTEAIHHLTMAGHTIAVLKTQPQLTNPDDSLPIVNSTHYLHQDHLDSVVMITDANGDVVEKNHYDAFGKKRVAIIDAANQPLYAAGFLPITDRSFTDHRYLNGQELIHMKGRVYDPVFGRFLSADPHIQSPLMSQSLNRYSYVLNNPLSLTDPSGYFFSWLKKLFKKIINAIKTIIKTIVNAIKKVVRAVVNAVKSVVRFVKKYWRQVTAVVVAVVATVVTAGALAPAAGQSLWASGVAALKAGALTLGQTALVGAVAGGLGGLVSTGSLKGLLYGAISGAAFAGIGNYFNGLGKGSILTKAVHNNAGKVVGYSLNTLGKATRALAHGIAGGFMNKLQGASFSKGLLTGFVNKSITPGVQLLTGGNSALQLLGNTMLAGGVSKLAGGSFSFGARIGFFATLFNDFALNGGNVISDLGKGIKKFFGKFGTATRTYLRLSDAKRGIGVEKLTEDIQDTNNLLKFANENPELASKYFTHNGLYDELAQLGASSAAFRYVPYGLPLAMTVNYFALVDFVSNNSWWINPIVNGIDYLNDTF